MCHFLQDLETFIKFLDLNPSHEAFCLPGGSVRPKGGCPSSCGLADLPNVAEVVNLMGESNIWIRIPSTTSLFCGLQNCDKVVVEGIRTWGARKWLP